MELLFYGMGIGAVLGYGLSHLSQIRAVVSTLLTEIASLRAELGKLTGGKL